MWKRRVPAALLVFAALLAAPALPVRGAGPDSLLVLPFSNRTGNSRLDWIGESVSELVAECLASEGIGIVAPELRDQAMEEMGMRRYALITQATAIEAAAGADASLVLHGSFDLNPRSARPGPGATIRIDAHLLDARRLSRKGAFLMEKPLEALSSAGTQLAWQVFRTLRPEALVAEDEFQRRHPEIPLEALENYARGLRASTPQRQYKYFAEAARIAPSLSPAMYRLGSLNFFVFRDYPAAASWFEKVPVSSMHYREALFYLAICRYRTGEFAAAASALRTLAAAAPLPEVLNNLGAVLIRLNDPAAVEILQAAAEAAPSDPAIQFNLGYALWRAGRFEEAAAAFRRCLQAGEDATATLLLGRCLQRRGLQPGDIRLQGRERLKTEYREEAWMALRSLVPTP
jgi:tetratricopeptide (TPR) repeat protein